MKKLFKINLLCISILLSVNSCEGLLEEDIIEEGSYMFWSNFDGPRIDVFIEGNYFGTITQFYNTSPGCNADGCVTVTLEPGTYEMYAIEQTMSGITPREWNDVFTIRPNACGKKGLTEF